MLKVKKSNIQMKLLQSCYDGRQSGPFVPPYSELSGVAKQTYFSHNNK